MAKQTFTTGQILTAAQMTSLQQTALGGGSTTAKTTSYTLVAADAGTVVQMNSASATIITVNTGLFAAGDTVQIQNVGAGVCTVTAGTATINTSSTLSLKQYDAGSLYFNSASAAFFFAADAADSPLTTKGDLYTYSTTNDRLAVGNNGETLVADSAATTGLRYQAPIQQNPLLNSSFQVAQRGTTFAIPSSTSTYGLDRWTSYRGATGSTVSRQNTSDTTNLPNIQYCARVQRDLSNTSTSIIYYSQAVESINTIPFAGKSIAFSFYARAGANYSATSNVLVSQLTTGTGTDQAPYVGYTGVATPFVGNHTLTTTWQRFTATGTIGSTTTEMLVQFQMTPTGTAGANDYFEVTGIQLEVGSVATPFHTYAATIQEELAACQRYYYAHVSGDGKAICNGYMYSATAAIGIVQFPVTMRTTPTSASVTGTNYYNFQRNGAVDGCNSLTLDVAQPNATSLVNTTEISGVAGNGGNFQTANASSFVAFQAEL